MNCVLTSIAKNGKDRTGSGSGAKDFDIKQLVHIQQPARFFKPAIGIEIVVRSSALPTPPPCLQLSHGIAGARTYARGANDVAQHSSQRNCHVSS